MREWLRGRNKQTFALVILAVLPILTVGVLLVVPGLTDSHTNATTVAESSGPATATPGRTNSPIPTPTSSATSVPDTAPKPQPLAPKSQPPDRGKPPAPQPAPPQPTLYDPAIIAMNPGPSTGCGEHPSGQATYRTFTWTARDGNTVDVYYALTDTDVRASSGFMLLGSDLAATGSVQISQTCPNGAGVLPYLTVKLVAKNALGSATAFYWGL